MTMIRRCQGVSTFSDVLELSDLLGSPVGQRLGAVVLALFAACQQVGDRLVLQHWH